MPARVKFAVVREDHELEAELVRMVSARAALVVASGGCTALSLKARFPELHVTAFDRNPAQIEHVRRKQDAIARGDLAALNVGDPAPEGLNQSGDFEWLFRQLRSFVEERVTSAEKIREFFDRETGEATRAGLRDAWFASTYWPVTFSVYFHDATLHAMFGKEATQHAQPGSYAAYFRRVFERGLTREDAARNPFLQHVFLGEYRREDAPPYVSLGKAPELELVTGSLEDVPALERFQVVSLSNVFDWSQDDLVRAWADRLAKASRPGTAVLIRALNNDRSVRRFFEPHFRFDDALGEKLLARDRSLFYERIEVGFRTGEPT